MTHSERDTARIGASWEQIIQADPYICKRENWFELYSMNIHQFTNEMRPNRSVELLCVSSEHRTTSKVDDCNRFVAVPLNTRMEHLHSISLLSFTDRYQLCSLFKHYILSPFDCVNAHWIAICFYAFSNSNNNPIEGWTNRCKHANRNFYVCNALPWWLRLQMEWIVSL